MHAHAILSAPYHVRCIWLFKGEKILSTPSFGGEVKPSVACRRFVACKRSLNGVEFVVSTKLLDNNLAHIPNSAAGIYHVVADVETPGGEKWEHLKSGENNGKLHLRTCSRCSCLIELWSLPRPAQSLNTNNNNNKVPDIAINVFLS